MNRRDRSGLAMLIVIALVAVSALLLAGVMKSIVTHHRQTRLQHEHRQCRLLADAGLERAASLLAADAEYQGETWSLAEAETGYRDDARVEIKVERNDDGEPTEVIATATIPATGTPRVTHSERQKFPINQASQ
jgi:type II secretory pathway component PulK